MKVAVRVSALIIILFFYSRLYAQNKIFPGFYITPSGDTIKGTFPNYKQWNQNPANVEFIESATSKLSLLSPENCLKFSIENYDEYIAYSGQRLENSIEDPEVINNNISSADQYANIVTFLRLLSKNKDCELYIFSDSKRVNFFYKLPGDSILELKYKKYYVQNKIYDLPEYKQQLMHLFSAQIMKENLAKSLNELPYSEIEMTEFFDKLSPGKKIQYKKKNSAAGWVLSAGISINMLKVKGDESNDKVRTNYASSISPLVAVGYIFPLGRNFSRYFIFPQAKLFTYENTGKLNDGTFIKTTTFKSNLVVAGEINGGVYVVNGKNFRLHLSCGAGIMLLLNNKEVNESYAASNNTLYTSSQKNHSQVTYTINTSAGITIKNRILILTTYNFLTPAGANYLYYTPMMGGIQFRVGYKLN